MRYSHRMHYRYEFPAVSGIQRRTQSTQIHHKNGNEYRPKAKYGYFIKRMKRQFNRSLIDGTRNILDIFFITVTFAHAEIISQHPFLGKLPVFTFHLKTTLSSTSHYHYQSRRPVLYSAKIKAYGSAPPPIYHFRETQDMLV